MSAQRDGVDVSWPQGDYHPASGQDFIGVGAVSLDGGAPFVQKTYAADVDNAHAAGLPVVHYAFNGRTDHVSPAAFAQFLIANLHDFRPGFDVIALDVESSEGGKYPAWTPAQAESFRAQLASQFDYRALGIYGNESDMSKAGWGALEKAGCWLWIAWPGPASGLRFGEWSDWTIWQNSTAGGIDRDVAKKTIAEILGTTEEEDPLAGITIPQIAAGIAPTTLTTAEQALRVEFAPGAEVSNRIVGLLAPLQAQIAGLTAAVQALATSKGADPAAITAAVTAAVTPAVDKALANIQVAVTTTAAK